MSESINEISLGRFKFGLAYRQVPSDEGPTIHVHGPADGKTEEVMRFDCFKANPHYHKAFSYERNAVTPIDDPNAFAWAVGLLRSDFTKLMEQAHADSPDAQELADLDSTLDRVLAGQPTPADPVLKTPNR